ncbi:hypothetical protein D3C71_1768430 [compost metagenome]
MGCRQARATQATNQGMRGRGRKTLPPGDQVPDDAAQQRAQNHLRGNVDHIGVEQARRDCQRHGGAGQRADEVHERGQHHRPAGRKDFGRYNGGDGVCRVMEAVDELEDERGQDHHQN